MRRFAKPLYGLTPVPRVRIPPSPPVHSKAKPRNSVVILSEIVPREARHKCSRRTCFPRRQDTGVPIFRVLAKGGNGECTQRRILIPAFDLDSLSTRQEREGPDFS